MQKTIISLKALTGKLISTLYPAEGSHASAGYSVLTEVNKCLKESFVSLEDIVKFNGPTRN